MADPNVAPPDRRRHIDAQIATVERVSIHDAMRISGMKMRTLQSHAAQGLIPGAAKPVRQWTFDVVQLRKWAQGSPEDEIPCRKISMSGTTSTGRVSRLPDAHTENLYMFVLNQRGAQRRTGFVRFKFHDLRHLFAVRYLRDGGSIYALQGILGHNSIKTTEIYLAYLTPDQQQGARFRVSQKGAQLQRFADRKEDDYA